MIILISNFKICTMVSDADLWTLASWTRYWI